MIKGRLEALNTTYYGAVLITWLWWANPGGALSVFDAQTDLGRDPSSGVTSAECAKYHELEVMNL
jgi:hypothetical protein